MEGALPLSLAFGLLLLELGDKTHLAVISLAARHPKRAVFLGAVLALAAVAGTSVLLGTALTRVLGRRGLRLVSSGLFVAVGLLFLVSAFLPIEGVLPGLRG